MTSTLFSKTDSLRIETGLCLRIRLSAALSERQVDTRVIRQLGWTSRQLMFDPFLILLGTKS